MSNWEMFVHGVLKLIVGLRKGQFWVLFFFDDVCKISGVMQLGLFADDINLFLIGDTLEQLLEATDEMKWLKIWFDCNKLSLNVSKTKVMLFGNCNMEKKLKMQMK